jgi:hypothetical protein
MKLRIDLRSLLAAAICVAVALLIALTMPVGTAHAQTAKITRSGVPFTLGAGADSAFALVTAALPRELQEPIR